MLGAGFEPFLSAPLDAAEPPTCALALLPNLMIRLVGLLANGIPLASRVEAERDDERFHRGPYYP